MAHWQDNELWHNWFGSKTSDLVGKFLPNKPESFGLLYRDLYNKGRNNNRPYVFIAYCIDDTYVRYYYSKPSAEETLASYLNWQNYQ